MAHFQLNTKEVNMRLASIAVLLALGAFTFVECQQDAALECDPEACQLPTCRCLSTDIPGGLDKRNTPQVSKLLVLELREFFFQYVKTN